ncbi:MAG: ELWxxDGT repeat protein, partial [Planctomycetaceae bacterium]
MPPFQFRALVTAPLTRLRRGSRHPTRTRPVAAEVLEQRQMLSVGMVKDIRSDSPFNDIRDLTNVNGTLFFAANDGVTGYELWKSDGTSTGTVLVNDIRGGGATGHSFPLGFTNSDGALFFSADDGIHGTELWKSDGTSTGTVLVNDIRGGGETSHSFPLGLTNVNGTLFFIADDGINGTELWRSDGTSTGTVLVNIIRSGGATSHSYPRGLTNVNGTLFFQANDGINGVELWKSDGTSSGTLLVKNIRSGGASSGSNPGNFINFNGTLFFSADDGVNGRELWKSDGTSSGTVLVKNIRGGGAISSSNPVNFMNVNGTLFFRANDGVNGSELWKSDGTSSGTVLVRDISSGSASSTPVSLYLSYLTNLNGTVYFTANDGSSGLELWKSDGTSAGTVLVQDIRSGAANGNPSRFANVNGVLFFRADDGISGMALWRTLPNSAPTNILLSAVSFAENQPSGTSVGTLSTTDPDTGDSFTYTLVSGNGSTDNASFTIDGGTLKSTASFDYETQSSYAIRVRTTDQDGLWFEKEFIVSVNDVNETPFNIALSATSVAENQASGTTVGSFSTTDADAGNTFTYMLVTGSGDTDNGSFTIDGYTLKTAESFDFETQSSSAIRVRTTDQGKLWFEQTFTITVLDGNDAATQISLSNVVSVLQASANTSSAIRLADVSVTDDGLGTNTFSVSGADASVFEVVAGQLRLKAGTVLNYATKKTYSVTVNVDDTTVGSTPDASVNYSLNLQGLDGTTVQNGSVGRSYVRYVSLDFGGLEGLAQAVASIGTANPRIRLFFGGTTGTQSVAKTLTAGMVSLVGNQV